MKEYADKAGRGQKDNWKAFFEPHTHCSNLFLPNLSVCVCVRVRHMCMNVSSSLLSDLLGKIWRLFKGKAGSSSERQFDAEHTQTAKSMLMSERSLGAPLPASISGSQPHVGPEALTLSDVLFLARVHRHTSAPAHEYAGCV